MVSMRWTWITFSWKKNPKYFLSAPCMLAYYTYLNARSWWLCHNFLAFRPPAWALLGCWGWDWTLKCVAHGLIWRHGDCTFSDRTGFRPEVIHDATNTQCTTILIVLTAIFKEKSEMNSMDPRIVIFCSRLAAAFGVLPRRCPWTFLCNMGNRAGVFWQRIKFSALLPKNKWKELKLTYHPVFKTRINSPSSKL